MRLLILGALGPYPERVSTFLEAGHELWYICTQPWLSLEPFPHLPVLAFRELGATVAEAVEHLGHWIKAHRIEAVYSLLNVWDGSNAVTAALLRSGCPVPVIRHYKEHYLRPFEDERICLEQSTGVIFINEESRDYFAGQYQLPERTACLDADLLPRCYLAGTLQTKLSAADQQPHVLIAGSASDDGGRYDYRELIRDLTRCWVHVHLYGRFCRLHPPTGQLHQSADVQAAYQTLEASGFFHLHPPIVASRFVTEWSRYDVGLLHSPQSDDAFRTLNLPNRYSAYLAAGLPVALQAGTMPAMQRHLEELKVALTYHDPRELAERLTATSVLSRRVLAIREQVTFEAIFPRLMAFIRTCLDLNESRSPA